MLGGGGFSRFFVNAPSRFVTPGGGGGGRMLQRVRYSQHSDHYTVAGHHDSLIHINTARLGLPD